MFQRIMLSVVKLRFRNLHLATLPSPKHQSFGLFRQQEAATLSESSSRAHRTQLEKNATENGPFTPLPSAISQVEGTKPSILKCETSPGVSISEEKSSPNVAVDDKLLLCRSPVCENAQQNSSPVVDEIVAILFAEDEIVTVEERLESSGLKFDSLIIEKVIRRCFKKPHSAWRFFHWAKLKDRISPTTNTYSTMLKIMGESKEFVLMEELMEEMECKKNTKTWSIPIYYFGKAKLVDKALFFLEKMERYGPEPDVKVYFRLIDALCRSGKLDMAMELYKETVRKKIVLHVNIYKTLVAFLANSGDAADVRSVADDMIRLANSKPLIVYSHMLDSFCTAQKLTEALETLRSIVDKNLGLKPQSCEALVKELSLVGRNEEAMEIVDMMKKRQRLVNGRISEVVEIYAAKHTPESVMEILRNCKLHGQAALSFFNWVGKQEGYSHTTETYETAIKISRNSVPDIAIEIFEEMIQTKHVPSKDLIATLLDRLCDTNRFTDARKCVEHLTDVGYSTEQSYSLYIRALCSAQMMKQALEIVNEVESKGEKLDSYAYASLVHGFLRKGNSEAALAKVEDMRRGGTNPTVHVYTPLMVHFFKQKQVDKAMEIFEKMKAEGRDPTVVTYSVIVRGCINSGKVDEALRVFNQMKEKGLSPSFRVYEVLISGLCSHGRSEEAVVHLLPEMFRNGIPPSLEIYRSVITGLKSEGKHDLALKIQQRKMAFVDRGFGSGFV